MSGRWVVVLLSRRVKPKNYGFLYGFLGKLCGGMMLPYLPCFTWFFLVYGSIKILSYFFLSRHLGLKQCILNTGENYYEQLSWEIFLYFWCNNSVEHLWTVGYATVFPIQNKFQLVILAFYFDLALPVCFLKWNRFFLNLYTSAPWVT